MDEENKMMEETTVETATEENEDNDTSGSPIGLILAGCGAVAGGLFWVGKNIFGRKKNYTEVIHHGRFGKE